jgi:hypothetical protein
MDVAWFSAVRYQQRQQQRQQQQQRPQQFWTSPRSSFCSRPTDRGKVSPMPAKSGLGDFASIDLPRDCCGGPSSALRSASYAATAGSRLTRRREGVLPPARTGVSPLGFSRGLTVARHFLSSPSLQMPNETGPTNPGQHIPHAWTPSRRITNICAGWGRSCHPRLRSPHASCVRPRISTGRAHIRIAVRRRITIYYASARLPFRGARIPSYRGHAPG